MIVAARVAPPLTVIPPVIISFPLTSRLTGLAVVPTLTALVPTDRGEFTSVFAPENSGMEPAVPPLVVTGELASGWTLPSPAAGFVGDASAKAEAGSPPSVAASAAFIA